MKLLWCAIFSIVSATPLPDPRPSIGFGSRIIGGHDVDIEDYNYQASLRNEGSHSCGAIILSTDRALTAAHCVYGRSMTGFTLYAGSNSRLSGGVVVDSLTADIHENYLGDPTCSYSNDLAMLTLSSHLIFSDTIGAGTLPSADNNFAGHHCDITGWGKTDGTLNLPEALQDTTMVVLTNEDCYQNFYWYFGGLCPSQMCIYQNGKGHCNSQYKLCVQGDSGGPMTCWDDGPVVAGSSSWIPTAEGNCLTNFPSVYTRLSSYLDWINERL